MSAELEVVRALCKIFCVAVICDHRYGPPTNYTVKPVDDISHAHIIDIYYTRY